jgi:uncharacterized protein
MRSRMSSTVAREERFSVSAPVARVWRHLLDPERIVVCLPGAELIEVEDERTFHGQMKVKVGPITVGYKGTIALSEVDEAGRRIRMEGKGKEQGGAGSAKMTMESHLVPVDQGCEVVVTADVQLAGRIARMGRGMIQSVARQLFEQFAGNVRAQIEEEEAAAAGGAEPAVEPVAGAEAELAAGPAVEPVAGAEAELAAGPAVEPVAEAGPADDGQDAPVAVDASVDRQGGDAHGPRERQIESEGQSARQDGREERVRQVVRREAEPVRILPILFRALRDAIAGIFKKLFGRRAR